MPSDRTQRNKPLVYVSVRGMNTTALRFPLHTGRGAGPNGIAPTSSPSTSNCPLGSVSAHRRKQSRSFIPLLAKSRTPRSRLDQRVERVSASGLSAHEHSNRAVMTSPVRPVEIELDRGLPYVASSTKLIRCIRRITWYPPALLGEGRISGSRFIMQLIRVSGSYAQ